MFTSDVWCPFPMFGGKLSWCGRVLAVLLGLVAAGCAAGPTPPSAVPTVLETRPIVVTPYDEALPREAFDQALARFEQGDTRGAAELFDRIAQGDDAGELVAAALYDGGVAWEQAGERERALTRFGEVTDRFGPSEVGKLAALRSSRLLARLERWSTLSSTADRLLLRTDLTDVERLEGHGAKALALVEVGDADGAERFISKGRDAIETLGLGRGGKLPLEAAQVEFALGEMRKLRSERIRFIPLPASFGAVLEERCRGLLDAQNAYTETMRSYDPHWAAMAGFRVGELYDRLYRDLLAVPPPKSADTEDKRRLFQGAMRLRYRVLLEKGLAMMGHTLLLADKTGETSAWIDRAREAKDGLERALEEQKAVLAKLPYAEKDLERALRDLADKKGGTY
jgi:tetratricopeptide (TPR) repeat protein